MKGVAAGNQPRAGQPRLQEAHLHLHGDAAAGRRVERTSGDRHGNVQKGHDDAAVRHIPAVEMVRSERKRDGRAARAGLEKLDA